MRTTTTDTPAAGQRTSRRTWLQKVTLVLAAVAASILMSTGTPAQAAAGTTTVRLCASGSSLSTPSLFSYWWNGSTWVMQQSARATCATFTLSHNGYYHFMASAYALAGCSEYVYQWSSGALVKQNLAASSSLSGSLAYAYTIPLC